MSSVLKIPAAAPRSSFLRRRRQTLWNEVEKAEPGQESPACIQFDIALQNEFSMQENIGPCKAILLRAVCEPGMVVDFSVHAPDKGDSGIANPHFMS